MSHPEDQELQASGEEEDHSLDHLGHRTMNKKDLNYHTTITSPDAMSTLDVASTGLLNDEFAGTGLDKDVRAFRQWKRTNYVAKDGNRGNQIERMVEAQAQKDTLGSRVADKILGDINK